MAGLVNYGSSDEEDSAEETSPQLRVSLRFPSRWRITDSAGGWMRSPSMPNLLKMAANPVHPDPGMQIINL